MTTPSQNTFVNIKGHVTMKKQFRQRNQLIRSSGLINEHKQINKLKGPFLSKPLFRNPFSKFVKQISS